MQFRAAMRCCATLLILADFLSAPVHAQGTSKLVLTVTPLGAATKDKLIPVSSIVGIDVTLKNESGEPLTKVELIAKLSGVKLAPDSEWKPDGDNAKLEIATIKPNEEIKRRLNVRVEMAPLPPGRQAEVLVEAKAGEALVNALTKFPVGDCASAFQADLTRLRLNSIAEIWPTADDMRKPDTTLPRGRLFRIGIRRGDLGNLDRIAAGYQARLLADYEFLREGVRYTVRRWSDELKAFAGQEPNPGICAANDQMLDGIRKTISYVTVRIEPPQKAYARAIDQLRKALGAEDGDDLRKIALRTAEEAGAKIENPVPSTLKLLEQAKDALKDAKLTEAQLDNLSLIESVAWIEAQALRSKKLADLIEGSIAGIGEAQKKNCVCAY